MTEPAPEEEQVTHLHIGHITVEEYLDAETGERCYTVESSDMPLSTSLGLLRLAEHWLIAETHASDDEDEDDDD